MKKDPTSEVLSGIQLVFSDNSESPFFEAGLSEATDSESFDVNTSKEIRFINMRIYGVYYEAL